MVRINTSSRYVIYTIGAEPLSLGGGGLGGGNSEN